MKVYVLFMYMRDQFAETGLKECYGIFSSQERAIQVVNEYINTRALKPPKRWNDCFQIARHNSTSTHASICFSLLEVEADRFQLIL